MTITRVTDAEIEDIVACLEQAALEAAKSSLRRDGSAQPPTVHMFAPTHPGGYVGLVQARPFYRGTDAALTVRQMGLLPAAMYATRLLVTWEHVDLLVALGDDVNVGDTRTALVVLDARADGTHMMRVHPFELVAFDARESLTPRVLPRWAEPERVEDGHLPEPVEELLGLWREGYDPRQLGAIYEQMLQAGYGVHLYSGR